MTDIVAKYNTQYNKPGDVWQQKKRLDIKRDRDPHKDLERCIYEAGLKPSDFKNFDELKQKISSKKRYNENENEITTPIDTSSDLSSLYKQWIQEDIKQTCKNIVRNYDGKTTTDTLSWLINVAFLDNGRHFFTKKFYNYLKRKYKKENIPDILRSYDPYKRFIEEDITLEDYLKQFLKENGGRRFEILVGLLFTLYDIPCPCCKKKKTVQYLGGINNPVDFKCSDCGAYIELKAKNNKGFGYFRRDKKIDFGSYWNFRKKEYYVIVINQEEGKNFCKCVKAKCDRYEMRFVPATFTREQVKSSVHVSDVEDYPELEKLVKANIKQSLSKPEIQEIVDKIIKEELETQSSLQCSLSRLKNI
jgi:hypothetical protein